MKLLPCNALAGFHLLGGQGGSFPPKQSSFPPKEEIDYIITS